MLDDDRTMRGSRVTVNELKIGPLKTRETPRQKRAQDRVTKILQATATALRTLPPHRVSTTIIAGLAGIPVSSIYRYFAAVEDIFDELYEQSTIEVDQRVLAVFADPETYPGWRDRHRAVYAELRKYRNEHPYYLPLLRSSIARTGPETVDIEKRTGVPYFLADRWANGEDGFQGGDPNVVAEVTIQLFLAIEGFVASEVSAEQADTYFEEVSLSIESYLANYLSDRR